MIFAWSLFMESKGWVGWLVGWFTGFFEKYFHDTACFAELFSRSLWKNQTLLPDGSDAALGVTVVPPQSVTVGSKAQVNHWAFAVYCWYFYMNYEASFDIWHFLWSSVPFYEYLPPHFKSSSSPSCRQFLITGLELSGIPGPVLCEFLSKNVEKVAIMCTDLKSPLPAREGSPHHVLTCSVDWLNKRAAEVKTVIKLALNCLEVIICWGKICLVLGQCWSSGGLTPAVEGRAGALDLALPGPSILPLCQTASLLVFGEEESCSWWLFKREIIGVGIVFVSCHSLSEIH